jgi:dienelactone hydrolase
MRAAILFLGGLGVLLSSCGLPPGEPASQSEHALLGSAPCTETAISVRCTYDRRDLPVDRLGLVKRRVYFQQPQGTPPAGGWPVVLLFQGSFFSAELVFQGIKGEPFGAYYQGLTVKELLEAGFAVLAPQTHLVGTTFWDTNIPPWSIAWELSPDHSFMLAIFDAIEGGELGPLDPLRLYAAGISSGGYMTSRMAVSYPGRFKALAIQSASYATCPVGPLCIVPALPDSHPPTLFLEGLLDPLVPVWTTEQYRLRLVAGGHKTQVILRSLASHEWIPEAPKAVVDWFLAAP